MTPEPLAGIYRSYKRDTDAVASWLASTARAAGFVAEQPAQSGNQPPTAEGTPGPRATANKGRLKGKQRKEARAKYTVALRDFVPMADFIAKQQKPRAVVPVELSLTLDRVIASRLRFARLWRRKEINPDPGACGRHDFFVDTLNAVKAALSSHLQVAQTAAETDQESIPNRFTRLKVEEPSDEFLEWWHHGADSKAKGNRARVTYEAETPNNRMETLLRYMLVLEDVAKIRLGIMTMWKEHKAGLLDLGAAALATNAAVSLARGIMDEVEPPLQPHKAGLEAVTADHLCACQFMLDQPEDPNAPAGDRSETFIVALTTLHKFTQQGDFARIPLSENGELAAGAADAGPDPDEEDMHVALEMLIELAIFQRGVRDYPFEDELMRMVRELRGSPSVKASHAFALQTFLDVRRVMRGSTHAAHAYVTDAMARFKDSLRRHVDFHKGTNTSKPRADIDARVRSILGLIEWVANDPVHVCKTKLASSGQLFVSQASKHRMMRYSPVMAGLWLQFVRRAMCDVGVGAANAWASISSAAHLHNALRTQTDLLDEPWEDLDQTLALVGESCVWVGGVRPDNKADCIKRYAMQQGISLSFLSAHPGQDHVRRGQPKPKARPILPRAPISTMMTSAIREGRGLVWTAEEISRVTDADHHGLRRTAPRTTPGPQGAVPTPDGLVQALASALHGETAELAFPYLTMHRSCWELLREIRDKCSVQLRPVVRDISGKTEEALTGLVGDIMVNGMTPDIVPAAAAIIKQTIEGPRGRVAITEAEEMGIAF
jgi:hypothetical protein